MNRAFDHSARVLSLLIGSPLLLAIGVANAAPRPTMISAAQQTAPTASPAAARASAIDEVVVTARRRGEESLQDVSAAVSVFSAEDLRKSGITDFSAVAARTPSFTFGEQIGNQQELVIRGIGTLRLTGAAADPSVGLFLDEVYIGRRGTATPPIFDLERTEVVRGPQGTLYGKNVVGGAVNLITAKPSQEFGAGVTASYGQYDARGGQDIWQLESHLTGGLTENLAGRIAVQYRQHDGYSYNILRDEELDDYEGHAVRASLLYTPSEALSVLLTADLSSNRGGGQSRFAEDDPSFADPGPVLAVGRPSDDPRESTSPWSQGEDRDTAGGQLRLDYLLGNGLTLTSLTAARYGRFRGRYSLVGITSPPSLTDAANGQVEQYNGFTQDLRVASNEADQVSWIAGLYYLREETTVIDNSIATSFLSFLGPGSVGDILQGEMLYDTKSVTNSYAAYGEFTYQLRDDLALTLGGRYTADRKRLNSRTECLDFGGPGFIFCLAPLFNEFWDIRTSENWSEFTPKLTLEWSPSDYLLLYLNVARGFKGGGWQGKPGTTATAQRSYDPETAWTYETGLKSEWADGRIRANVAAFYTSFDDLQVEQLDDVGLTLIIDNAADARIMGLEVELTMIPTDGLRLWLNAAYLDSEYRDFIDSAGVDLSGNQLARTPKRSVNIGVDFTTDITAAAYLDFRVEYNWQSRMPWLPENTIFEGSYGLLDARIAAGPVNGNWEVAVFGRNLADRLYRVDTIPFAGDTFSRFGLPRSYGLQFSAQF
jgi:iron complex outermembrane receptor protein